MKPIACLIVATAAMTLVACDNKKEGPLHAQVDCADWAAAVAKPSWNSLRPFFEAAEASDVVRCLQEGADPNETAEA